MLGRLTDRCYAFLLQSFPSAHQARYGSEMLDAFERERIAIGGERGFWAALRFVIAACWDAVVAGRREHRNETHGTGSNRPDGLLFGIWKDIRDATRNLARSWTFTVVCLTSLAIGLGINLAIITIMWLSLSPPPGVEREGAVELMITYQGRTLDQRWTYPDFDDVKNANIGADLTGWVIGPRSLRTDDGADDERVSSMYVSANYFQTLGVNVAQGRAFLPQEDDVVGEPPVVVTFDTWKNRLGSDPDVVGRLLTLNRTVHRVVGVAPEGFNGHFVVDRVDLWVPLWEHPRLAAGHDFRFDRSTEWLGVLGRLNEGTNIAQASGALASVMSGLAEAYPATNEFRGGRATSYSKQGRGAEDWVIIRSIFFALELIALLIVSLNVAGMVLVRSATRERELALRLALGSSRARLVRYLLTESGILAVVGGMLALAVGWGVLRTLESRSGMIIPEGLGLSLAAQCLGWSLVMMMLIGLSPALRFSRPAILGALKDDSGVGGRRSSRIHRAATSIQVAVALPLIVVTAMVLQSTQLMNRADYGFEPDGLMVAAIELDTEGYSDEEVEPFMRALRSSVVRLPGLQAVSLADGIPLDYQRRGRRVSRVGDDAVWTRSQVTRATEGYFEAIGTPILRGRGFESGDVGGAEGVAVVTESVAERLWPEQEWLGQRIRVEFGWLQETELTVVGVVADVVGNTHDSRPLQVFASHWQNPTTRIHLVVRASSEDAAIRGAIRDAILALDPDLTPPLVVTSRALMEQRNGGINGLSVTFGGLAVLMLLLAALGVYGVVGFAVTNRTREIGVRMALGASRARTMKLVLMDAVKLVLPGIVVGSALAAVASQQILASWYEYFGRSSLDWVVVIGAAGAALAVVLLASSVPARRAAGVQPMEALRGD